MMTLNRVKFGKIFDGENKKEGERGGNNKF